jgi:hypothetical protein
MMNAASIWQQPSWPYGINFYGFRVKPTDNPFQRLGSIIESAAGTIATTHENRGPAFFLDSGLDLVDRLHTFNSNLITQLKGSAAPHALDFSGIADGKAVADLLGFGFPHSNILSVALSAQSTHVALMSQQWGGCEDWLETNFEPLGAYLAQLVQGKFIDRNGTKLAFSLNVAQSTQGLPQTATNLAAESPQIAGELIYALVEYLGDQEFQVPCYDPSAGQQNWHNYTCAKAQVITQVIGPDPKWTYTGAEGAQQDEYQLAGALIAYTSKAFEAAVKSITGSLIRGVTVVGLNNEAIAEIIATALAVAAKKLMEAFTQEVLVAFIADASIDAAFKDEVFAALQTMLNIP